MQKSSLLGLHSVFALAGLGGLLAFSTCADSSELRTYTNRAAGYTVSYPADWYALPPYYSNAFEIRNYDASHDQPEKDQASIIISQEAAVSPEQGERRIQDLVSAAAKGGNFHLETLPVGEHLLYQWTVLEPTAVPAGRPSKDKPAVAARMRMRVASAVTLGPVIVRIEGTAWEDADSRVISAMKEITRSVKPVSK